MQMVPQPHSAHEDTIADSHPNTLVELSDTVQYARGIQIHANVTPTHGTPHRCVLRKNLGALPIRAMAIAVRDAARIDELPELQALVMTTASVL